MRAFISDIGRRGWRDRISGQFATETSQQTVRIIFCLWLVAFLLKHAGSAWDISWHFRYVFGALEPPHWLNVVGNTLAAALFAYQIATGKAVQHTGFLVMQISFVIFLIHMPLDVLNHYLFGLDVTVWSPTHVLGFAATTLMMVGLLHSWLRLASPGGWWLVGALICWAFLLDDVMFQLGQQEYGVIALDAYARGMPTAGPELLAMAGRNPEQFVRGGIPDWLYPVWMILMSTLVLTWTRRTMGWRFAATLTVLIYLTYRVVGRLWLGAFDFPVSFIPVMLIGGGLVIDLAEGRRWRSVVTAAALVAVYYISAAIVGRSTLMPEFAVETAPFVFCALWIGLAVSRAWQNRRPDFTAQVA
jgi:hypothetical protein